ncbi:MAG: hypothetical protein IJW13_00465 [Clostridia bacterium]|nr:hypothetical protein [Clostridia bacterium]
MQYYVISIFVFISLLCTGFASWVTVGFTVGGSAGGSSFGAYQSINTEDYVTFAGLQCFSYCKVGFVENNAFSDSGTVTVTYTINCEAIKAAFPDGKDYKIKFTIYGTKPGSSDSLTIFDYMHANFPITILLGSDINSLAYDYEENDSTDSTRLTYSIKKSTINDKINSTSDKNISLTVKYTFSHATGDSFITNIYNQIHSESGEKAFFYAYATLVPTN